MKKFNPDKEINKMRNIQSNSSRLNNLFVPILVMGCSCMAMAAVAFSAYLEEEEMDSYKVHIDIINGDEEEYERVIHEGAFSDTITSANSFGSIECTSGALNYDPITQTISSPYINRNTSCVIAFMNDGVKNLEVAGLSEISDNKGLSHYYKADVDNNYVLINNMMFRIVRINGDGSIRLMLNDVIMASSYGDSNDYMNSHIKNVLDDWFKSSFNGEDYLVTGDYDVTNYDMIDTESLVNLEGYYEDYVGLLSVREVEVMTKETDGNSLNVLNGLYLSNGKGFDSVYVYKDNKIDVVHYSEMVGVRPVININAKLMGSGTINNPYTISN